jgi:Rad3-related DNA helicase
LTTLAYLIAEGQTEGLSDSYLGSRKLLVLDEAHNLEDQCLNHISVRVGPFTLPPEVYGRILPELQRLENDAQVKALLEDVGTQLESILEKSKWIAETSGLSVIQVEVKNRIEQFLECYKTYKASKCEWVWQTRNDQLLLQPVFGREFIRDLVWKRAEYYIISSATILDPHEFTKLTGLLDFLNDDQISVLRIPSTFPVENRPVIDAMVGPLSRQEWGTNMPKAIHMIEQILHKEPGNVAIHCHGYQHQRYLAENISTEFTSRLIIHTSRDREQKLDEWIHSRGKVFVSVAFNEGQDWKYDVCDAQILLKVPFPDLGDKRVKRRLELGHRKWYENQAMLEVIQAYGRAMRAEDDSARFYIIDGSFSRLMKSCWNSTPDWFKEALPASMYARS